MQSPQRQGEAPRIVRLRQHDVGLVPVSSKTLRKLPHRGRSGSEEKTALCMED